MASVSYRVEAERTFRTSFVFTDEDIESGDSPEEAAEELMPDMNSVEWELVDWDTAIKPEASQ